MEAKTQARIEKFFAQTNKINYTIETTSLEGFNLIPPRMSREVVSAEKARVRAQELAEGKSVTITTIENSELANGGERVVLDMVDWKTPGNPLINIY
jgi:hypothetical protein